MFRRYLASSQVYEEEVESQYLLNRNKAVRFNICDLSFVNSAE